HDPAPDVIQQLVQRLKVLVDREGLLWLVELQELRQRDILSAGVEDGVHTAMALLASQLDEELDVSPVGRIRRICRAGPYPALPTVVCDVDLGVEPGGWDAVQR